jgi:hypothetical protein
MKMQIKSALVAIAVAAAAASAQAGNVGDLILGFTVGSGNDLEYDLGQAGTLSSGETWNLSSLLGGLNVGTVKWGVVGTATESGIRVSYQSKSVGLPGSLNGSPAWTPVNSAVSAIGSLFTGGTPNAMGQNVAPASTLANSWNQQTVIGGTGKYVTVGTSPNGTGYITMNFYRTVADNSTPSLLGTFSFGQNGIVTFNAIPEPATFGAIAGAGLLLVSLRSQFRRMLA